MSGARTNLNTDSKKVEELGQVKAGEGGRGGGGLAGRYIFLLGRCIFVPISFLHADAYLRDWYILSPQSSLVVKGNLSNDDGDVNENGKKAVAYVGKTTTLHVHVAFLYISLPSLHDYDVNLPNFTFCQGREHKATTFFFFSWTSIQSLRIQLQKKDYIWRIEWDGISATEVESARIHFLKSGVFVAVAAVVA